MLKAVAATLIRNVRASDVVARFGGDEFVAAVVERQRSRGRGESAGTGSGSLRHAGEMGQIDARCRRVRRRGASWRARYSADVLARADTAMYARKSARKGIALGTPGASSSSRDNIGRKLVLDEGDAVAQVELALLQPLHLDDVGTERVLQRRYRGVEVAMLLLQARKLLPSSRSSSFVIAALVAPGCAVSPVSGYGVSRFGQWPTSPAAPGTWRSMTTGIFRRAKMEMIDVSRGRAGVRQP